MSQFNGFSRETLTYLYDLKNNNNKTWFEENRDRYNRYLLEPFKLLVCELSETMLKIDPDFEVRPQVDKTISRIYRDIRFSNDKSPYRPNMWLTYKRNVKDWKTHPAFFFELFDNWYRYGMGYYAATREVMDEFKRKIDTNLEEFLRAISFYKKDSIYSLEGEDYKRIIKEDLPEEIQKWYQKKTFYLVCNKKINDNLFSYDIVDELKIGFTILEPLYRYLQ